MNKPNPKDFPPESPHDIEWGGYNYEKYSAALEAFENSQGHSEDKELLKKYVYWKKDEIECYNMAIDDSIKKVKSFLDMMPGLYEPLIIQLESLKKKQ